MAKTPFKNQTNPKPRALRPCDLDFCDAVLRGMNPSRAYLLHVSTSKTVTTPKEVSSVAWRYIRQPHIAEHLSAIREEARCSAQVDAGTFLVDIVEGLKAVAAAGIGTYRSEGVDLYHSLPAARSALASLHTIWQEHNGSAKKVKELGELLALRERHPNLDPDAFEAMLQNILAGPLVK